MGPAFNRELTLPIEIEQRTLHSKMVSERQILVSGVVE